MKIMSFCHLYRLSVLAILLCGSISAFAQHAKPFVIPELKEWKGSNGNFIPAESAKIVCDRNDAELMHVAQSFAADYETMFGKKLAIASKGAVEGDFIFRLKNDKKLGQEGYAVVIVT